MSGKTESSPTRLRDIGSQCYPPTRTRGTSPPQTKPKENRKEQKLGAAAVFLPFAFLHHKKRACASAEKTRMIPTKFRPPPPRNKGRRAKKGTRGGMVTCWMCAFFPSESVCACQTPFCVSRVCVGCLLLALLILNLPSPSPPSLLAQRHTTSYRTKQHLHTPTTQTALFLYFCFFFFTPFLIISVTSSRHSLHVRRLFFFYLFEVSTFVVVVVAHAEREQEGTGRAQADVDVVPTLEGSQEHSFICWLCLFEGKAVGRAFGEQEEGRNKSKRRARNTPHGVSPSLLLFLFYFCQSLSHQFSPDHSFAVLPLLTTLFHTLTHSLYRPLSILFSLSLHHRLYTSLSPCFSSPHLSVSYLSPSLFNPISPLFFCPGCSSFFDHQTYT